MNPGSPHWECGVLATRPQGSLYQVILKYYCILHWVLTCKFALFFFLLELTLIFPEDQFTRKNPVRLRKKFLVFAIPLRIYLLWHVAEI